MDMKRLLNSSSITGSGRPVASTRVAARGVVRRRMRWFSGVTSAVQPGSTTVVALASRISAGPARRSPASRASRSKTGASCALPSVNSATVSIGAGAWPAGRGARVASSTASPAAVTSAMQASTTTSRSGVAKPKRWRWAAVKASSTAACVAEGDGQEAVGAGIAQVQPAGGGDAGFRRALLQQLGAALRGQGVEPGGEVGDRVRGEGRLDRALADRGLVGQAHAIGAEHAGEGVDEDGFHAELVGHQAGMLAAGAAEALQGVAGDVVALLDGDLLDGVRHVGDGDAEEAFRHRARVLRRAGGGLDLARRGRRISPARRRHPAARRHSGRTGWENAAAGSCRP